VPDPGPRRCRRGVYRRELRDRSTGQAGGVFASSGNEGGLLALTPRDRQAGDTKSALYRGFTTPCTCLALDSTGTVIFGGAWEKKIIAWDVRTRRVVATFTGHADFVKSVLYLPVAGGLLLSGSSDANIIVWSATTGARLATLKGHTRAVGAMALDPVASSERELVVLAGGSERDIRRWRIPVDSPEAAGEDDVLIREFETSVHCIRFLGEDADCWAASADGSARRLDVRAEKKDGHRTDTLLKHPDYVNDIAMAGNGRWVITACRDEEVRVWDVVVSPPPPPQTSAPTNLLPQDLLSR